MLRLLTLLLLTSPLTAADWVTVKGTLLWPNDKAIPQPLAINRGGPILPGAGALLTDNILVNAKNRGLKNVWVYLRPDSDIRTVEIKAAEIHPNRRTPKTAVHTVDAPRLQFEPKILALRSGDKVEWKNTTPVPMNWKIDADDPSPSFTINPVPFGGFIHKDPFVAQKSPIIFSCVANPWMQGCMMVFDHPYFAVTDADGKFEIKDCPAGKYRLVYRHEFGYHKGRDGRLGWPVEIKDGGKGVMTMEPVEFHVPDTK